MPTKPVDSAEPASNLRETLPLAPVKPVDSAEPAISLHETLLPTPVKPANGALCIHGRAKIRDGEHILVRATTSMGQSSTSEAETQDGRFSCRYPDDFPDAPSLSPGLLYLDATDAADFGLSDLLEHQAEALVIVSDGIRDTLPDLPMPFTDDLIDASGKKDEQCAQWLRHCALVNLYVRSRGAKLAGIWRPGIDLSNPADFAWFRATATLYDFDYRDRDWSRPLGNRVAPALWQAEWNDWFTAENDHPWDGNQRNLSGENYRPYAFSNDHADLLILHQMRRSLPRSTADDRDALCRGALSNLLAMQHREPSNFALPGPDGAQEHYTAGAFRYGMFDTGEWLTEGTGWFADPSRDDYRSGGVFNGRCVWALGESLKADPQGPQAAEIQRALPAALRFCFHDSLGHGYAQRTNKDRIFWHDVGEHSYLLLGMIAAAEFAGDLPVGLDDERPAAPLKAVCATAIDALIDRARSDGGWTDFPDQDAIAIAALCDGVRVFPDHLNALTWLAVAQSAADAWLGLTIPPEERPKPTPHFGLRVQGHMSHFLGDEKKVRFTLYVAGHWLHALAKLYRLTGELRYRERCEALLSYLCGANPFHTRLLTELGAVYNYVDDRNGDGLEDQLHYDFYPESTAFVQIGLLHFLLRE